MITIRLEGYSGKISALISGEVTATGTVVHLHGPLADAIGRIPHAFTEPDLEAHVRKAIEALPHSSVVGIIPLVMKSTNGKASPDAIRECFNRLTADTVIKQYDSVARVKEDGDPVRFVGQKPGVVPR